MNSLIKGDLVVCVNTENGVFSFELVKGKVYQFMRYGIISPDMIYLKGKGFPTHKCNLKPLPKSNKLLKILLDI